MPQRRNYPFYQIVLMCALALYIEPPFETVLRQNKARSMAVPESVIRKLAEKCEPPTWLECHTLIVTDGNHGD